MNLYSMDVAIASIEAQEAGRSRIIGKLHCLIRWLWKNKGHHSNCKMSLQTWNQS